MFVHLAAFRWQDDVTEEESERLLADVRAIADDLSGVRAIHTGLNVSGHGRGLTHAIMLLADDAGTHKAYQQHPNHVAAGRRMDHSQEISESHQPGIVVDFIA